MDDKLKEYNDEQKDILKEITTLKNEMESGRLHPKEVKVRLAKELTARFHDQESADKAGQNFEQVFARHELPDDIPECEITAGDEAVWLPKLLLDSGMVTSTSDGRRMIKQNAVSIDGEKVTDVEVKIQPQGKILLKVGKRRFCQVTFVSS